MIKKTNALRILDRKKIAYTTLSYQYDATDLDVATIAKTNNLPIATIYKTLVLKGDKSGAFVAVIPGDTTLDLKAVARVSGNKKVQLLAIKELEKTTGYIRGGCSPIGMKKNFPVYIDQAASSQTIIYINAGTRGLLIAIQPQKLRELCNYTSAVITQKM